jgi:hypothetical protein
MNVPCLQSADKNLKGYLEFVAKLAPEQSDAKFAEARDKLSDQFVRFPFGTSCSVDSTSLSSRRFWSTSKCWR